MEEILKLKSISKKFRQPLSFFELLSPARCKRKPITALEGLSLSLLHGQCLAVLGLNGAGKSTLLKIISNLILPDSGKVILDLKILKDDDMRAKSYISLITSDERSFYWRISGRQNLEFYASLYGLDKKTANSKITQLLNQFGIDYEHRRFDKLSSGMRKRLALARGLLHEPRLILFDEPTKDLDLTSSISLRSFIKDILLRKEGRSVIFTTHDVEEASIMADVFLVLRKGRQVFLGDKDSLIRDHGGIKDTEMILKSILSDKDGGEIE